VAAMVKLQQLVINKPDAVHQQSRAAIQQLSAMVATSKFAHSLQHIMMSAIHHN